MKEVNAAREEYWASKLKIEEQRAYLEDRFIYGTGGERNTEKKTVSLQRDKLYEEIWTLSLTKVAKQHDVPYQKLKEACEKSKIPLPTQSYWSNLYIGKNVEKTPLPPSDTNTVSVTFSVRTPAEPVMPNKEQIESFITEKQKKSTSAHISGPPTAIAEQVKSVNGKNLYERETLYEEVWNNPVTKVAEKYGVSDVMIHKVCKALEVPVPPRGYWAKKEAGQPTEKTPLPDTTGNTTRLGNRTVKQEETNQATIDESLSFLPDDERFYVAKCALQISVDPKKRKLHPMIIKHKADCEAWAKKYESIGQMSKNSYAYRELMDNKPSFCGSVSSETYMRLYRILDALYSAIEELGGSINSDLSVQIRGEHVRFSVSEAQEQVKHALTKEEQKKLEQYEKDKKLHKYAYEPKFQKYDYLPTGKLTFTAYRGSYIKDTTSVGLENRVGEILISLYMESEAVRLEREAKEAAIRKAEEEKRQKELRRQRYNDEIDKLNALKQEAADFETACKIRAYIAAIESKTDISDEQKEWISWAKAKADWYDPTKDITDPILGKKDHSSEKEPEKIGSRWW